MGYPYKFNLINISDIIFSNQYLIGSSEIETPKINSPVNGILTNTPTYKNVDYIKHVSLLRIRNACQYLWRLSVRVRQQFREIDWRSVRHSFRSDSASVCETQNLRFFRIGNVLFGVWQIFRHL